MVYNMKNSTIAKQFPADSRYFRMVYNLISFSITLLIPANSRYFDVSYNCRYQREEKSPPANSRHFDELFVFQGAFLLQKYKFLLDLDQEICNFFNIKLLFFFSVRVEVAALNGIFEFLFVVVILQEEDLIRV